MQPAALYTLSDGLGAAGLDLRDQCIPAMLMTWLALCLHSRLELLCEANSSVTNCQVLMEFSSWTRAEPPCQQVDLLAIC